MNRNTKIFSILTILFKTTFCEINSTEVVHFYTTKVGAGINGTSLLDASRPFYDLYTNISIITHKYSTAAEAIFSMLQGPPNGFHIASVGVPNVLFYGSEDDPIKLFTPENISMVYINSYNPIALASEKHSSFASLIQEAEKLGDDEFMNLCSPEKYDAYYLLHKNIQNSHPKIANKLKYHVYPNEEGNSTWESLTRDCAAVYCDMSSALGLNPDIVNILGVTAEQSVIDLPDTPIFKNIGINDDKTTMYKGFAVSSRVPERMKELLAEWFDKVSRVNDKYIYFKFILFLFLLFNLI